MTKTRPSKLKKLMAVLLVFALIFGTVPLQATANDLEVTFISGGGLTLGNNEITFAVGNFTAQHEANVGDTNVVFYMNVTVSPQGGTSDMTGSFDVPSNGLLVIPPVDAPIVLDGEIADDESESEITFTWYQDGQRRGEMGHTVIPNPRHSDHLSRHSGLDPESPGVRVELRFDTVWATDGGVWTLRAYYDGFQFVESPYNLDLTVAPIGIMPLSPHPITITSTGTGHSATPNPAPFPGVVTINAGSNPGFSFAGWTTGTAGVVFADSADSTTTFPMVNGPVAITANWTAITYNIAYNNLLGGTHTNPATYTIQTPTISLTAATRAGYTFCGWWTALTGGTQVTQIVQGSSGNLTLWARWTPNTNTPYRLEWRRSMNSSLIAFEDRTGITGTTANIPLGTFPGYTFDPVHPGNVLLGTIAGDGSTVLMRYFTANTNTPYRLEWRRADSSLIAFENRTGTTGANVTIGVHSGGATAGYTFDAANPGNFLFGSILGDGSRVFVRYYNTTTVTVSFNPNGMNPAATLAPGGNTRTVNHGQNLSVGGNSQGETMPGNPTRPGYDFVGWFDTAASSGGTAFTEATAITENRTVHARWTTTPQGTRTVTFNPNGVNPAATLAPGGNTRTVNHGQNLSVGGNSQGETMPGNPTRPGYTFAGWFDTPAPSGGNQFTTTTAITANRTVYARWTAIATPTITITTQPAPNTTVTEGSITGNLTIVANVTPSGTPTFQWFENVNADGTGGTAIAGATNATLTIPTGLTAAGSPYRFAVQVSATGATPVRSNTATLTVTPVPHIPVTGITGVNTSDMIAGQSRTLTGTVSPANATSQTITWSIQNARTTGATITGNTLRTVFPGTVTIAAIIANGIAPGVHFTQHFNINVTPAHIPVTNIIDLPTTTTMGVPLLLTGIVIPANATNRTIFWSVQSQGTTSATITDNTLHTTEAGTAIIRATISNGTAPGVAFIRNFSIIVTPLPALTAPPTITGPTAMTLTAGDSAAFTESFTVTGSPMPAVTLNVTPATDLITWNNAENRIDIAAGLAAGTYTVRLTAENGINPNADRTFTLTVTAPSDLNGWRLIDNNLVFYRNGIRVGQGQAGPSGQYLAQNLITPGGAGDFLFNNQGHLLTGLRSYGGEWHYFHTTHGTRLLSAVSGWWGWQLAPGQLRYLHADGTWAEDELITITWDCNYGGPSQAGYLFDADGFLVTDFDFDVAGGFSVHAAFGQWHVMATHSFNRVGNFNAANGGGWIQPRPGVLRYLVDDGTYVTGPATLVDGRVTVPADRVTDAWTTVNGNEFLFDEDGYLQFGWVYVDGHRVAYIDGSGIRVVD